MVRLAAAVWGSVGLAAVLVGSSVAVGNEPGGGVEVAEPTIDYARDVKPILARRCIHCHGPSDAEGGLRLHTRESAVAQLESGVHAIVSGQPEASELIERIASDDEFMRMPPEGEPLTDDEVATLRQWIAEGAPYAEHWAFVPRTRPDLPAVENDTWPRNPIDHFILARLEAANLQPNPPADKRALVRRLYFDVTGLPPTPEEVEAFVADPSSEAYERLVDELLDSPHYGERWGRLWLDLVRFAETNSYERDGRKANAWKYRDYVIRAFNDDKPYDQFLREQLAGDELDEVTAESMTATGFYRLGVWDDEPADRKQAAYDGFDDIIRTTSEAFLGLTVGCARCHDHKIDPISHVDYHQMLAFFHDITPHDNRPDGPCNSQHEISSPELLEAYHRLDREERELRDTMRAVEQRGILRMSAPDQRATEGPQRNRVLREKLQSHLEPEDWDEYQRMKKRFDGIRDERRKLPARELVLSVANVHRQPPKTQVFLRGNPHVPGDEVEPDFPSLFGDASPEIQPVGDRSSGRRRALADWMARDDNLLTARVMANRVWQQYLGRGLVRSSNNFGGLGTPPTHPELLDWLASELVDGGWRIKPLARLILTSQTYRMSSRGQPDALARDPANDLFWRVDMRRLAAEEVRDAVLATSGRLNRAMFGPGVYPTISKEVLAGQSRPGEGWGRSSPEEQSRRSIYIFVKRSLITPLLAAFDYPDPDNSCEVRFQTTQPAQALAMLNSAFLNEQAGFLAERVTREAGDDRRAQLQRAVELAFTRPAEDDDVARGLELIQRLETEHDLDGPTALKLACLVLLNQNEFLYLD